MKKTILLLFFVSIFLLVTGCKKDEVEAIPDETTSGGWEIILSSDQIVSNNDALEAYNKAKEIYVYEDFDLVALLAKQIVAGTNYMYLVKNEKEYKILVVYNDLDGNAIVNSLTKFNYVDYTRKEIDNNSKNLSGGWIADYPSNQNLLPNENIQKVFDDATKELTGISFNPITVLGTQVVAGKNYAILSYGKLSTQSAETGIYLLTVYEDLEGNSKLIGNAYIDLSKYNN